MKQPCSQRDHSSPDEHTISSGDKLLASFKRQKIPLPTAKSEQWLKTWE